MKTTLTVRREGNRVAWIYEGRRLVDFGWRGGDALCKAIKQVLTGVETKVRISDIAVQREAEERVVVSIKSKVAFDADGADIDALLRATTAQCRLAEEEDAAEQIAFDGALLLRVGSPLGLTDNPKIQSMVRAEASTNRTLRTALPGMRDTVLHGAPIVRQLPSDPLSRLRRHNPQLVASILKESVQ